MSEHYYVRDTVDGGLAAALHTLNNLAIPTWPTVPHTSSGQRCSRRFQFANPSLPGNNADYTRSKVTAMVKMSLNSRNNQMSDYLMAECHCGGVRLAIQRADYQTELNGNSSLHEQREGKRGARNMNTNYVRTKHEEGAIKPCYAASDPSKFKAYLCACRSCRLTTGTSLVPWMCIHPSKVFNAGHLPVSPISKSCIRAGDAQERLLVHLKYGRSDDPEYGIPIKSEDEYEGEASLKEVYALGLKAINESMSRASNAGDEDSICVTTSPQSPPTEPRTTTPPSPAPKIPSNWYDRFPPTTDPAGNYQCSMRHYWSFPDTCRSFCGRCGATIYYWCEKRPDEISIAVGILRAKEGVMARRWLEWEWGRCSFSEECIDREVCQAWLDYSE